jgi:hypothetical protein
MTTHQPRRIRPHATPKPPKPAKAAKPHGNTLAVRAATLAYDYAAIPEQHRELVQRAALDIRSRLKRTVEDMIEIGKQLSAVKAVLEHGQYHDWIKAEFGMSIGNASEHRSIAARFDGKVSIIETLTPTTARLLAPSKVSDEVIAAFMAAAKEAGRRLQVQEVRAIRDTLQPRQVKQLPGPVADYSAVVANPPFGEKPTITAEYTVIAADTDLIHLTMPRGMVRKLQVGALRNQQFREAFSGDELDRLNIILSKALKGEDEDDD